MKLKVTTAQKLVPFLQNLLSGDVSGKKVRRLLEANLCRVNGRVERFGSSRLQKGDLVELAPDWNRDASVPKFKVLFEDADLLLVDKPMGWVCSEENCRRDFGQNFKLGHRLDKDTTGVLGVAKNQKMRDELVALFADREVEKEYLAIVDGVPRDFDGVRESTLVKKRVFEGQTVWGSGPGGLFASTRWKKVASGKESALLLCQPLTGRTHQIRVHLAEMGHPILVDRQYADTFRSSLFASRPLLHASRLSIRNVTALAAIPTDFKNALASLGINL